MQPTKAQISFCIQTVFANYVYIWAKSNEKLSSNMHKMFRFIQCLYKVSSRHLLTIVTFLSVKGFCYWTAKALIRLHGCAVWSGPSLSTHASKIFSLGRCSSIEFYGPVNPLGSCQAQLVFLTTLFRDRLSPLSS